MILSSFHSEILGRFSLVYESLGTVLCEEDRVERLSAAVGSLAQSLDAK